MRADWADLLTGAGRRWRERGTGCSFTLLSPFNFPIHFPHIVRRREFCSGLIHHLMRATKSLLKSFSNNTFWRLRMRNNSFPPKSLHLFFIFLHFPPEHLSSISYPALSLTPIWGDVFLLYIHICIHGDFFFFLENHFTLILCDFNKERISATAHNLAGVGGGGERDVSETAWALSAAIETWRRQKEDAGLHR